MILFLYWVTNLAYDRFIERPFGVVVGWTFDGAEAVLRPTGRAIVRFATWLHGSPLGAALRRWLPDLTWPALERLACAITLVALAVQHVQLARRAADDGHGVHRAELPQLAAGMLHWRWAGACARPADGVLSHHLAALPLRLGWDADGWDDAARWKFANATAPPPPAAAAPRRRPTSGGRAARCCCRAAAVAVAGPEVEPALAAVREATLGLVRHARSLRLVAVAAPLQLLVGVAAWWLWGGGGAVVAAALACYSPTALALSPLVTADALAALLVLGGAWAAWWLLHSPSAASLAAAALCGGLALGGGPLPTLLLPPIVLLLGALRLVAADPVAVRLLPGGRPLLTLHRRASRAALHLVLLVAVAAPAAALSAALHAPPDGRSLGAAWAAALKRLRHAAAVRAALARLADAAPALVPALLPVEHHAAALLAVVAPSAEQIKAAAAADGCGCADRPARRLRRRAAVCVPLGPLRAARRGGAGPPGGKLLPAGVCAQDAAAAALPAGVCAARRADAADWRRARRPRALAPPRPDAAPAPADGARGGGEQCSPQREMRRGRPADAPAADADGDADAPPPLPPPPPRAVVVRWLRATRSVAYRSAPCWGVLAATAALAWASPPSAVGHRLLFVAYPALHILAGGLVAATQQCADGHAGSAAELLSLIILLVSGGMGACYLLECVSAYPHYLAYFAPLAGGSHGGHFHLLGPSLDEGQHLPALRSYLDEHTIVHPIIGVEPVYLAYSGEDSPGALGIAARRAAVDGRAVHLLGRAAPPAAAAAAEPAARRRRGL